MPIKPVRWKTPSLIKFNPSLPKQIPPTRHYPISEQQMTSLYSIYFKEAKTYRWIFFALALLFTSIALATTQCTVSPHLHWLLGAIIPTKLFLIFACLLCSVACSWIALHISPQREPIIRITRKARKRLQKLYLRHSFFTAVCEAYQSAREEMEEKQEIFIASLTSIIECQILCPKEKREIKERLLWELKFQLETIIQNYRNHLTQMRVARNDSN